LKKIIIVLFVLISLAGCSKDNSKPIISYQIEFWHFWSEPYQKALIDSLVQDFEKSNGCEVNVSLLSWADGKTKLLAAFNSGTAPDVLELGSDWVPQFSSVGVLKELGKATEAKAQFLDFSLQPSFWKNKLYALPWVVDTRVLFANFDLLKKSGVNINPDSTVTYDELLLYSDRANTGNGYYGIGITGSDAHKLYKKLLPMFWSFGGGVFDKNGKLILDCPENIKALEMYCDLSRNGLIETQRQLDAGFVQGKIAFCFSGSWMIDKIRTENPKLNYAAMLMPKVNGNKGISFAGGEYLSICKNSKNPKLAEKFIRYMTDGVNSSKFCKKINVAGFPADKKYYNSPDILQLANKKVFAEQLNFSRMTPMNPKWLDIEPIIEEAAVEALYGKKSAEEALKEAKQKILDML
jgi:multiple sugar transport system substrate-binding protein